MTSIRPFVTLSVAALLTACASATNKPADEHAAHHPQASASAPAAEMAPRMMAMQDMHEKMMNAKTPAERQALMADHMKAMHEGMGMMKGMGSMGGMGDMAGAKHQQMLEQRMDMMQMMMEMMMDRLPSQPAGPVQK
jgi:hypothetical protein